MDEDDVILEVVDPAFAPASVIGPAEPLVALEPVETASTVDPARYAESGSDALLFWVKILLGVTAAGTVYGFPFFVIGAFVGFVLAGAASCLLVLPFALSVRTLAGSWQHPLAGPAFGGIVGFVCTSAVWKEIGEQGEVILFVLGPMMTTLLGQAGGFLANRSYAMQLGARRWRRARATGGRARFSILAAMIATAWVAVAMNLLKAYGLFEPAHGAVIAAWLPWQCLLLWLWSQAGRKSRPTRFT